MSFRVNNRLGVVAVRFGCGLLSWFVNFLSAVSWLSFVVGLCQYSRNSCRRGLLPVLVNGFAARSVGFGSSPFSVNFSSALGVGGSLTYFVDFGAAADYRYIFYIKIKIVSTYKGNGGNCGGKQLLSGSFFRQSD